MTVLQRIRYVWVRLGLATFLAMPFVLYATFRPWGVDAAVLEPAGGIKVIEQDVAFIFEPAEPRSTGLLLVPGCPVDPVAYTPLARGIAEQGHRAVVVKVPYRCAPLPELQNVLDHRVRSLATRWPDHRMVLAGHSRGAVHAARIVRSAPERFAGFILMGTSHPRDLDLSTLPMPVTKIVATNDGVAGEEQYDGSRLPADARWVRIEGGNHSQFAHYGFQLFDRIADISREEQQAQILAAVLSVLGQVETPVPAAEVSRARARAF